MFIFLSIIDFLIITDGRFEPDEFSAKAISQGVSQKTVNDVFIPLTVGGGIRSLDDVELLLRSGADKIAINTEAVKNPNLISEVAKRFGSQCMVVSIQAKQNNTSWEAYYDNGREHSGLDAIEWAQRAEKLGAGELLVTSVDNEGMAKGFDCKLIKEITDKVNIPVIISGGMGNLEDFKEVCDLGKPDAVAMAHVLHYDILTVKEVKDFAIANDIHLRHDSE